MSAANANGVEGPDHRGEMTMHPGVSGQDGNTNNVFAGHGDPANGGTAASTSSGLKFVNNFDGAMTPADAGQSGQNPTVSGAGAADGTGTSTGTGTGAGAGPNPEARPFAPSEDGSWRGVRSPEVFMAHFRAMQAARAVGIAVRITAPHRRILFKDVPEWMTLSDILCLVYGGAVDRAWKVSETEYIVQFCDDKACTNYYDAHSSGIRVGDQGNHFIAIEKPEGTERAPFDLVEKMVAGHSRVIRITGITTNKTLQDLRNVAAEYEVDHIMWRDEVTKAGVGYVFFANMMHAGDFKKTLEAGFTWDTCQFDYLPDPCKVANWFHTNTIPCRMSSAAVNNA